MRELEAASHRLTPAGLLDNQASSEGPPHADRFTKWNQPCAGSFRVIYPGKMQPVSIGRGGLIAKQQGTTERCGA
eukprot:1145625-Pelagomonas_calceolata.AAC.10